MIVGEKSALKEFDMFTVAGKPYIPFDEHLPLAELPDIEDAIVESYPLIKQNTWQRTTYLNGGYTNCNWRAKSTPAKTSKDYFEIEVRNRTLAPMWILDLTKDQNENSPSLYDTQVTPPEYWENIIYRTDLPAAWKPMLDWIQNLSCFSKIGRTSLLITRPGIPIHYHRDIGVADEDFKPYEHRQEFLWLNMTSEKTLYILDHNRNPIQFLCRSAFFNHHNWHGSHESLPYWSFSFKIEGKFSEEFRMRAGFGHVQHYY